MRNFIGKNIRGWQLLSPVVALLLLSRPGLANVTSESDLLDTGYHQMYNLDFEGAHKSFQLYKETRPQDPLGPVSNAAAYLFSEFNRLRILEVDLFTDDQK